MDDDLAADLASYGSDRKSASNFEDMPRRAVSRLGFELSSAEFQALSGAIDPVKPSATYGIDLFIRALNIVFALVDRRSE